MVFYMYQYVFQTDNKSSSLGYVLGRRLFFFLHHGSRGVRVMIRSFRKSLRKQVTKPAVDTFLSVFFPTTCPLCHSLIAFPQNYDLSISEAPKLFSDAEFEAVKRIQQALAVLLLRKRFKVINTTVRNVTPGLYEYTRVSPFYV